VKPRARLYILRLHNHRQPEGGLLKLHVLSYNDIDIKAQGWDVIRIVGSQKLRPSFWLEAAFRLF